MTEVFICCMNVFFADDAKLYLSISNYQDEEILQGYVDTFEIWAELWDMNFNTKM